MKPRVFISTVSSELGSIRQLTANVLTRLGYEPVWQDIFGLEPGELKRMLRDKIDDCVGLIQIVGRGYGAEPPEADAEFGRVSYTQYELLYARRKGKKTWVLFAEDGCVHDRPLEQLDLPLEPDHPDPAGYQAERRALQDARRQRLRQDVHLWHEAASNTELELKLEKLKDEFAVLRRGFRRWQGIVAGLGVAAVLLIGCTLVVQWRAKRQTHEEIAKVSRQVEEVKKGQTITAANIRIRLEEASEKARDEELAKAEKERRFDERERLREQAAKAHAIRLSRIKDLADSFVELEQQSDSSPILREMTRILSEETTDPVDKALAYFERQRVALVDRVRARKQTEQERSRRDLVPLLKAAELEQTRGRPELARAKFAELLDLEPAWPQVLERFAYFLYDRSVQAGLHGSLKAALDDAQESFKLAERLYVQDKAKPEGGRVLSFACCQMGDVLVLRGQLGDAERALTHFERSLELDEAFLNGNPKSAEAIRDVYVSANRLADFQPNAGNGAMLTERCAECMRCLALTEELMKRDPRSGQAARDVSISLNKLGDFFTERRQPGDAEQALRNYKRGLGIRENLLKRNPDSVQAARDMYASLNRLGDFFGQRGQSGDAEQALLYYMRGLEISDGLFKRNPESSQAARDVSVSLERFGAFLAQRDQRGDVERVLGHYERALQICESLLKRNPDSSQAARDVSVALAALGDLHAKRGQPADAEQALRYYTRDLKISEELLKQNPGSGGAARDVYVSLNRLCGFEADRGQPGDAEQALGHCKRALEICESLFKRNPDSAEAARDLSFSLNKLADLLAQRGQPGDAEQALRHYARSLETRAALLKRNPDSAQAARDLSVSLEKLGTSLARRGQPGDAERALHHYTRSLGTREALLKRNPDSAQAARDVELVRWRMGDLDVRQRKYESAMAHFAAGITVLNGMIAKRLNEQTATREKGILEERVRSCQRALATGDWSTLNKVNPKVLPGLLSLRATELAKQGRLADVAQAGAKLSDLEPKTNGNLHNAACAYGLSAGLAVKGKAAPTAAEQAERKKFVDLSLACLKEAIAAGYNNFGHMRQDTDLAPLRGLPEFETLFPKPPGK